MVGKSVGLSWTTHVSELETVVVMTGEFDLAAASGVRDDLLPLLVAADARVRLDLTGLNFIDSTGVAFLLDAKRKLDGRAVPLIIDQMSPIVRRVLEVTGLGSWFSQEDVTPLATVTGIFDRRATG